MPLNKTVLSGLLKTKIQAIPWMEVSDEPKLTDFCDAIADAVVTHVVSSALVTGVAAVATVPSSAPVTGTVS